MNEPTPRNGIVKSGFALVIAAVVGFLLTALFFPASGLEERLAGAATCLTIVLVVILFLVNQAVELFNQ